MKATAMEFAAAVKIRRGDNLLALHHSHAESPPMSHAKARRGNAAAPNNSPQPQPQLLVVVMHPAWYNAHPTRAMWAATAGSVFSSWTSRLKQ